MAELLVTADATFVEATFSGAVPGELAPLIGLAVGRAGVRVIADRAVTGVVAEVVHQIGQVGLRVSQEFNCLWCGLHSTLDENGIPVLVLYQCFIPY